MLLDPAAYQDPGTCPICGSELKLKPTRRGNVFWSCTEYPHCKGAKDAVLLGESPESGNLGIQPRVSWLDGTLDRRGWICRYTNVGASLRSSANLRHIAARFGQVFVAQTHSGLVSDPRVVDVTSVLSKIVQRGASPPIHPEVEESLLRTAGWIDDALPSTLENDLRWFLEHDPVPDSDVDLSNLKPSEPAFDRLLEFDSEDERIFIEDWLSSLVEGQFLRWTKPQVRFSSIAPDAPLEIGAQRVDFLIDVPGIQSLAVEIDGSQHSDSREHDNERDSLLFQAGVKVVRVDVSEVRAGSGPALDSIEQHLTSVSSRTLDHGAKRVLIASSEIHRLLLALIDGMRSGVLSGPKWSLLVDASDEHIIDLLPPYLRLINAVSKLWGPAVSPEVVLVRSGDQFVRFQRSNEYQPESADESPSHIDLVIVLQFGLSAMDELPERMGDDPHYSVIRSAYLPALVGDDLYEGTLRRYVESSDQESFRESLVEIMQAVFAKGEFREGQYEAVEQILTGGDCTVLLPTGAGKSLIYQLAGLCLPGRSIVIDPLVALMEDQVRGLAENGIDRVAAISAYETGRGQQENILQQVRSGDALFIFIAPERLQKRNFRSSIRSLAQSTVVNMAVIDEAHCVSEWGHQFRLAYLTLGGTIRSVCRDGAGNPPPIAALTGTASRAVLRDVLSQLGIPADSERSIIRPNSFDREELEMNAVRTTPEEAEATLIGQLRGLSGRFGIPSTDFFRPIGRKTSSGIIFCQHASWDKGVWNTSQFVRGVTGTQPAIYAGAKPKDLPGTFTPQNWDTVKRDNASRFVNNEVSTIVTTNAFGMGIDKPNIRYVVHYGMPGSIEAFYQEVGRAGRDRNRAVTVLILDELDPQRNERLLSGPIEEIRQQHDRIGRRDDDDISRQLYFLLNTFKGVEFELREISNILEEIDSLGAVGTASTVELQYGSDDVDKTQRERAIYRLLMLGVVADYTIDATFMVTLSEVDSTQIVDNLTSFVERNFPGRQDQLPTPSEDLTETINQAAKSLIEMIYETLVTSRISSLNEMYLATRAATTSPEILRQRVLDYLTQGDVSPVFESLTDKDRFGYDDWIAELANYGEEDAGELRGTAARLLAASPDHPGLLFARGYAELVHPNGEISTMTSNLRASVRNALDRYGATSKDLDNLFDQLLQFCQRRSDTALAVTIKLCEEFGASKTTREKLSYESLASGKKDIGLMVIAMDQLLQSSAEMVLGRISSPNDK